MGAGTATAARSEARARPGVRGTGAVDAEHHVARLAEHEFGLRMSGALGHDISSLTTHQIQQLQRFRDKNRQVIKSNKTPLTSYTLATT